MMYRRFMGALVLALSSILFSQGAFAQTKGWPDKPIKLIIPFAAGGTTDIIGRVLAQQMTPILGQNVIVENRGGAGGNIGAEAVAKSPADGYTLLLASGSMLTVNPHMYKKMAINYSRDFAPISTLVSGPMIISVNPKLPVNNLNDLIALAKTKKIGRAHV